MTIGLTDTLVPLGGFAITRDTDLLGGYRVVADITARDAIPIEGVESIASRRKAGMLAFVVSNNTTYRLGAGLTNADWIEVVSSTLDVYLSGANGNDANNGLTPGTAVATFTRVWELLPEMLGGPFVVHIGDHGGGGYAYEQPPARIVAEGAFIALYGDGAGQGGEDGFTVEVTGAAGAATTALQLELAVPATLDEYRHYTLEFTTGAATGYLRQIRDNSTTIIKPVYAFSSYAGLVAPAPGDTYRIVYPTAVLNMPAPYPVAGVSTLAPASMPIRVVNVTLAGDRTLVPSSDTLLFGVACSSGSRLVCFEPGRVIAGAVNTATVDQTTPMFAALGVSPPAGGWHGWGLAFYAGLDGSVQCLRTVAGGFTAPGHLYGFVTGNALDPQMPTTLLGGSGSRLACAYGQTTVAIQDIAFPDRPEKPTIPLLLRSSGGVGLQSTSGGELIVAAPDGAFGLAIEIENTVSDLEGLIRADGGVIRLYGFINISATGTGYIFRTLLDGKIVSTGVNKAGETPVPWSTPLATLFYLTSGGSIVMSNAIDASCNQGFLIEGPSTLAIGSTACTIACASLFGAMSDGELVLTKRERTVGAFVSVIATCVAPEGILQTGGRITQLEGTFSVTNNAAGAADVLKVSGGAQANLLGGAATILDGSAAASGYGINARGGGRVFTAAQPSSVTGVTADLTVGAGGGEDQPDTFLLGSLSSLVAGTTLSSIARST